MYPAFSEEQITGYANGAHYDASNGADPNGHHHANGLETQLSAGVPEVRAAFPDIGEHDELQRRSSQQYDRGSWFHQKDLSGASDDASNEGQDSTAETAAVSRYVEPMNV